MKNLFKIILVSVLAFSISCDNEPIDPALANQMIDDGGGGNGGGNNNPTPGVFTAVIDGVNWTSNGTLVYRSGNSLELIAYRGLESSPTDYFTFVIDGNTVGNYTSDQSILFYSQGADEYGWTNLDNNFATNGTVNITAVDTNNKTISGTFSYIGYWSDLDIQTIPPKAITNGVFTNLPYVTEDPNQDSFYALRDGVEFVDVNVFTYEISVNTDVYTVLNVSNASNDKVNIQFTNDLQVGTTYNVNTSSGDATLSYQPNGGSVQNAVSGTIKITYKNALRTKGIFTFATANNTFTQGEFDIATL